MQHEVGPHSVPGLFVHDEIAVLVAQPEFGLVIVARPESLFLEYILQYGFAEVALHLVPAFEGLGEVIGGISYRQGLFFQLSDGFFEFGLDGAAFFGVALLLLLKGVRHLADFRLQLARNGLHTFLCLRLEGFLPCPEVFLTLGHEVFPRHLQRLLLPFLHLPQILLVLGPQVCDGLFMLGLEGDNGLFMLGLEGSDARLILSLVIETERLRRGQFPRLPFQFAPVAGCKNAPGEYNRNDSHCRSYRKSQKKVHGLFLYQVEKFVSCTFVFEEHPRESRSGRHRVRLLYTPERHTGMAGLDDHCDAERLESLFDAVPYLHSQAFLHLEASREGLDYPRNLAQTGNRPVRHVCDVTFAYEWHNMMFAGRIEVYVLHQDHLTVVLPEECRFQYLSAILSVSLRHELKCLSDPLRSLHKSLTLRVFTQQTQYLPIVPGYLCRNAFIVDLFLMVCHLYCSLLQN